MSEKETLLQLSDREKKERKQAFKDLLFYLGECEDIEKAKLDFDFLGQSWINSDELDYVPSQVIDNKVKPLINKQARFMFGKKPDILFKPYDKKDKGICEELRQYVDSILSASKFWSTTLKAFRLATVTKRVMLRLEANPGKPVRLYYHDINDFNYELDPNDSTKVNKVVLARQDSETADKDITEQLWYRYTYFMGNTEYSEELTCYLKIETFKGDNLEKPINEEVINTELSKIPCWIIINEHSLTDAFGHSDIKDLKPLQDVYNRRLSDFNDALRFLMYGQTAIIDATEETVNACNIAPNALMALKSLDDRQATVQRVESSFSNATPVEMFFERLEKSMYEKLGIPHPEQLKNVPSAKTLKYIYSELVARCEEKWHDWEPVIRSMLRLVVESCGKFNCYEDWNHEWDKLLYNIVVRHNYPIPEDEEDAKKLAMEEVNTNVRSHRSYIKDFGDDEEYEEHFKEVIEDITTINAAEYDQFQKGIDDELDEPLDGGDS